MNDIFQVDYLPDEKKIKINLPEEVWKNIDVEGKKKESEVEHDAQNNKNQTHT